MKSIASGLLLTMTHFLETHLLITLAIVATWGLLFGVLINKLIRENKVAEQIERVEDADSSKRFMIRFSGDSKMYFETFEDLRLFRNKLLSHYEIWERDAATGQWMYMGRGN